MPPSEPKCHRIWVRDSVTTAQQVGPGTKRSSPRAARVRPLAPELDGNKPVPMRELGFRSIAGCTLLSQGEEQGWWRRGGGPSRPGGASRLPPPGRQTGRNWAVWAADWRYATDTLISHHRPTPMAPVHRPSRGRLRKRIRRGHECHSPIQLLHVPAIRQVRAQGLEPSELCPGLEISRKNGTQQSLSSGRSVRTPVRPASCPVPPILVPHRPQRRCVVGQKLGVQESWSYSIIERSRDRGSERFAGGAECHLA